MPRKIKPRHEPVGCHPGLRRLSGRALEDCWRRFESERDQTKQEAVARTLINHYDGSISFTPKHVKELGDCLLKEIELPEYLPEVINELLEVCQSGSDNTEHMSNAPTSREVEAGLENIANLSFNLAHAIKYPDRIICGELGLALHKIFGDDASKLCGQLTELGAFAANRLATGIDVSKHNHVLDIEAIHSVLLRWGIQCKPSRNKTLRFYRIAATCFDAMGLSASPEDAIRQYQKRLKAKESPIK